MMSFEEWKSLFSEAEKYFRASADDLANILRLECRSVSCYPGEIGFSFMSDWFRDGARVTAGIECHLPLDKNFWGAHFSHYANTLQWLMEQGDDPT